MGAMADLAERLAGVVGEKQLFVGDAIDERYLIDIQKKYPAHPGYLVRPRSTEEVAEIVKLANASGTPITALGGRTGSTGAGRGEDGGILMSLELMNKISEIDPQSMTM